MNKTKDLTNQRFGMLTALSEEKERKNGKVMWLCKCDCGKLHIAPGTRLVNGKVHSCGCLRYVRAAESLKKHGKRHTRLYSIWANMKNRCHLESSTEYKRYGARGIRVCEEWLNDFNSFYNWAMENGYQNNLTIDRIENDGNYEPSNCRWTTQKIQNRNTRKTRYLTYNGKTQCIADWAIETGLSQSLIRQRIEKLQWSIERTLTTPARKTEHLITYKGKTRSIKQWSAEIDIKESTLRNRIITYGWSIEKALTEPVNGAGDNDE